ncbi:MAG: hypothetical protein IKJ87_07490 [Ruminococcus sp.]|nr:hypothetical protein [Ruminococcus sp.]
MIPKNPQELAELIDSLMSEGSGHVNVVVNDEEDMTVNIINSKEYRGEGACCQPTENAIDDEED